MYFYRQAAAAILLDNFVSADHLYLKDDDDEFEHLQDDDEFEGFDKERNVKGKGQEKPPDLKITKVSA